MTLLLHGRTSKKIGSWISRFVLGLEFKAAYLKAEDG